MKQRITCLLYDIILFFARCYPSGSSRTPQLAIIKTDEIGDFILWRNCLPFIVGSERFKEYGITLIGNVVWKSIFDRFDSSHVNNCIWVDKKRFKRNLAYRLKLLITVKKRGFTTVVNTVYSRSKRVDDSFVITMSKSFRIGYVAEGTNLLAHEKGYDRNLFNELFKVAENNEFDYIRNVCFTAWLIGKEIPVPQFGFPALQLEVPRITLPQQPFFVIFPGSGNPLRVWQIGNFINVAKFVFEKYRFLPVVCGGKGDIQFAEAFVGNYDGPYSNMCGKLSLPDFLYLLSQSRFLVSIDTGSVHMAASVKCPVFGLFNGSQFGRFAPYPENVFNAFFAIYPDGLEHDISVNPDHYTKNISLDYNLIDANKVINKIDNFIEGNS